MITIGAFSSNKLQTVTIANEFFQPCFLEIKINTTVTHTWLFTSFIYDLKRFVTN